MFRSPKPRGPKARPKKVNTRAPLMGVLSNPPAKRLYRKTNAASIAKFSYMLYALQSEES
jgi:hypothetical protein